MLLELLVFDDLVFGDNDFGCLSDIPLFGGSYYPPPVKVKDDGSNGVYFVPPALR